MYPAQPRIIPNADASCYRQGCQITKAYTLYQTASRFLAEAKQMEESVENENAALWCDAGEHAFSPRIAGKEKWRREIDDPENPGQTLVINWLICPEHKEELNKKFNTIRGEINTK